MVVLRDLDGVELPEVRWRSLQPQGATSGSAPSVRDGADDRGEITPRTILGPFPCTTLLVHDALTEESVWRVEAR